MNVISLHCCSFLRQMKKNPTLKISQVSTFRLKRDTGSLKKRPSTHQWMIQYAIRRQTQTSSENFSMLGAHFRLPGPTPPSRIPPHNTLSALIGSPNVLDHWSPLDVLPREYDYTMKFRPPWHQWESLIGEPFHKGMFSEPGFSNIRCTGTQQPYRACRNTLKLNSYVFTGRKVCRSSIRHIAPLCCI